MHNIYDILQQNLVLVCLALLLLLMQRCFTNLLSPRWQARLWGLLFLRALLPYGRFSGELFFNTDWLTSNLRIALELNQTSAYASAFVRSLPLAPWLILPSAAPQSVTDWLFLGYGTWVIAALVWFFVSWVRLCHRMRGAVPITGARLAALDDVAKRHNLRAPTKVVESKFATTPFVMGVFRPTLVLPMGFEANELIFLHELLHIKHHDVAWGWATTLLRCMYPILWRVCDQIDNDREAACDERVLLRIEGEARRDYGKALFAMADDHFTHQAGTTTMANGSRNIKQRITAIAKFRTFPRGISVAAACMLCVLFAQIAHAATPTTENLDTALLPNTSAAQALAYGQRNAPTTLAGALDFYTQGLLCQATKPWKSLAYRAAVSDSTAQAALYQNYAEIYDAQLDKIDHAFTTGPAIRALSQDGEGNYLCEVLFYRPNPTALGANAQDGTITYQRHIIAITEQADGTFQIQPRAITEHTVPSDDLSHLRTPTPVQWVGDYDGVTITYCDASQLMIHKANTAWASDAISNYLLQSSNRLSPAEAPERDADFEGYLMEHCISFTVPINTDTDANTEKPAGTTNNTAHPLDNIVGMKLAVHYSETATDESKTQVLYHANWALGQMTNGASDEIWQTANNVSASNVINGTMVSTPSPYTIFEAPENQMTYSTGSFYSENLQTLAMTSEPLRYFAVLYYEDGRTEEIKLERQVILP